MKNLGKILVAWLVVAISGCAVDDPDSTGTDLDGKFDVWGEGNAASHRDAVLQCERMKEFALERAVATNEIVQSLYSYQECLMTINNRAREVIDQNLTEVESAEVGSSLQTFADYRWASEGLCNVAVDWSEGADGTLGNIVRASCIAEAERALSDLIDSFVYFGDQQAQLQVPEDRTTFATCYQEQDAALETATANNEMIQAMHASADCIETSIEGRIMQLVDATLSTFPDRDAHTVEMTIRQSLETMIDLNGVMCSLVSEASDSGGGSMARLYQADCRSDADEFMFKFAGMEVAEASSDVIGAHLGQGQTPPIHPELGLFALYAPGASVAVYHFDSLAALYAGIPYSQDALGFGTCAVQETSVSFNCETEFSAQGCFLTSAVGATPITRTYTSLQEYDLYTPTAEELAAAAASESHFESFAVVTSAYMGLYYGTVDGQVYLLAIDLAAFSCDA